MFSGQLKFQSNKICIIVFEVIKWTQKQHSPFDHCGECKQERKEGKASHLCKALCLLLYITLDNVIYVCYEISVYNLLVSLFKWNFEILILIYAKSQRK
jgi:hypothetical protein